MDNVITRKCSQCGHELPVTRGARVDLSCQVCGSDRGILSGKHLRKFECLRCGLPYVLASGKDVYLAHDVPHCKSRLVRYMGITDGKDLSIEKPEDALKGVVLVIRNRGLGDVLMSTAILPTIRKKYPNHSLWYACDRDIMPVLENNPNIDRIVTIQQQKIFKGIGKRFNLLERLEDYSIEQGINKNSRIGRIAQLCGVKVPKSKLQPQYCITQSEDKWGREKLNGGNIIALGLESFASYRTWGNDKFKILAEMLVKKGYHVLLLGVERVSWYGMGIINATGQVSIRELGALLKNCSALVCGDTGLYHLAEAVKTPSIVLFGSIPPQARTSTYKYTHPVYKPNSARCVPCWDKQLGYDPDQERCRVNGPMCMDAIKPSTILKKVRGVTK